MTEEQRDIIIAKMIDSPSSLTDSEIDIITHDDELKGIYEMSAALCGAYSGCHKIDMPKEWALFKPNLIKKPLISRRVLQVAAILIVGVLTSYMIINIVGVEKGHNQNPEIANVGPAEGVNTDDADSRIASIYQERNVAQSSNMDGAKVRIAAASPHLRHYGRSAITSSKDLSELDPPQQSHLVRGFGSIPKSRHQLSQAEIDRTHERLHYWLNMGENLSDDEYMKTYVSTLDSLDIGIVKPEGFSMHSDKNGMLFYPNMKFTSRYFNGGVGWSILGPIFQSESKDALIAYPLLIEEFGMSPDVQIEAELIAAYRDEDIDITNMIAILEDKEVANADKVIIYEYDMVDTLLSGYNHCVALAFRKKNHYSLPVKILLNDAGVKNKDKYIDIALQSVKYGDQQTAEWIAKEEMVREDEGTFPFQKNIMWQHSVTTEEPKETMHASAIKNDANDTTFILPPEDPWVYDAGISNDEYMDLYRQSLKSIDIHLTPPDGFAQGEKIWPRPYLFSPNIGGYKSDILPRWDNVTSSCASPYFSANGDAIVLYPSQIIYTVHGVLPDYCIESELMMAYANDSIDCTSLVKRIPGKEAFGNTNADWVNIYEFDMGEPIQGKYSHCVGIALRKYNNYPFMIKLVMSDEGLKHKDKYIHAILNSVRYGNKPNKIMEESEKRVSEMEIPEGTYPRILPEYTKMNNQK